MLREPACGGIERGLRVIGLVCSKFKPGKTSRRELVRFIQEEFECSRATAYRTASAAIDVMGLVTREEDLDIQALPRPLVTVRRRTPVRVVVIAIGTLPASDCRYARPRDSFKLQHRGEWNPARPGLLSLGIRRKQVPRPMRGPGGD
jgi:hypothetical protein